MSDGPLREGRDYYVEHGLFVFTEDYLRRRGHCCESGCRHCPYGFRKAPNGDGGNNERAIADDGGRP